MYAKRQLPIGKKFNKLTVLKEVSTEEKCRRYVYCVCDCGSKKIVRYDGLKSGRIKSCGCLLSVKKEHQIEKMVLTRRRSRERVIEKNYVGKKFNRLTILSIYHHPRYKSTWFTVKCDCGKQLQVARTRLKKGHTRSCGCIRRKYSSVFVSDIDGEAILISKGKLSYFRLTHTKELLHAYEAKKLFGLVGKEWHHKYVVHHIDGNKTNNDLHNLAVLTNNRTHRQQHNRMEHAMYSFLEKNNLLDAFYAENPSLRLETLATLNKIVAQ